MKFQLILLYQEKTEGNFNQTIFVYLFYFFYCFMKRSKEKVGWKKERVEVIKSVQKYCLFV